MFRVKAKIAPEIDGAIQVTQAALPSNDLPLSMLALSHLLISPPTLAPAAPSLQCLGT